MLLLALALMIADERMGIGENEVWFKDPRGNKTTIYRQLVEDRGQGRVQAWVELDMPEAVQSSSGMVKSIKTLVEYDCFDSRTRNLEQVSHDDSGASLPRAAVSNDWRSVVPRTVGEAELAAVCKLAGYDPEVSFSSESEGE